MKIVAFGHRQNVGKDLASKQFISQVRGLNPKIDIRRVGLADKIKEIAYDLYSWGGLEDLVYYENHPEAKDRPLAPLGCTPREIWLTLGKAIQSTCPTTLINVLLRDVACDILVISDLRRYDEAVFLQRFPGSYLIKLLRDVPRLEDLHPDHPYKDLDSQLDTYSGWYQIIDNNGTPKDLNEKLKSLVSDIIKRID